MNKKLLALLYYKCLFLSAFIGFAQENVNFINLKNSFSQTSHLEIDDFGYLWISNTNGLNKYNGDDFLFIPYKDIFGEDFIPTEKNLFTKDAKGNFWIGSLNGDILKLKLNGTYKSYKKVVKSKQSSSLSAIKPRDSIIWFGFNNGSLYKHNINTSTIDSVSTLPKHRNLKSKIISIATNDNNTIWLSTSTGKVYSYSKNNSALTELKGFDFLKDQVQDRSLAIDKNNKLWISSESEGLICYDLTTKTHKRYSLSTKVNRKKKSPLIIYIFCDSQGLIWAGTDGDGLFRINPKDNTTTVFRHEEGNRFSIPNNVIINISEDSSGNIIIISERGKIGIYPTSYNNNNIAYYSGLKGNTPTDVLSILKASDGSLWVGTNGKGLNRILANNKKIHYDNIKNSNNYFEGMYAQSLLEDANQNIWISTYHNGLWVYFKDTKEFKKIDTLALYENPIPTFHILFSDHKDRIWTTSGSGIAIFSKSYQLLAYYNYNSNGLIGKVVRSISNDEFNNVWVALSDGGLFKFNENNDDLNNSSFKKHEYHQKVTNNILNYNIIDLKPDYDGNLWILCASGFIIKYHLKTNDYVSFAENSIFEGIHFSSMQFENHKSLWLSSKTGIYQFDIATNTLTSFNQSDGFQMNYFARRCSHKDKNGLIYFGGYEGVNVFNPKTIKKQKPSPKLYINDIQILNKPYYLIIKDQIKERIENTKSIKLKPNQSSFSFEFSAIDNLLTSNYHYAYRLKGFDNDWIVSERDKKATYTNIPSGNYTFEVKAGTRKDIWDIAPAQLKIKINPQWWNTSLAYTTYTLVLLFIVYSFITWLRLKNRILKEEWQHKKDKEFYSMKMNFFAKMSHEIQTPLTLVLSPIEDMINRASANNNLLLKQRLGMIDNNLKRLSRIATQLMTVRNKELGTLKILVLKKNIINDLKKICFSFEEQARFKNINFIQKYPSKELNIWYDSEKIEHIFYNLLSNAFKFTPKEGTIVFKVEKGEDGRWINFYVNDSGPGIPKDEIEHIFKLFYQAKSDKMIAGSGIGLALTKELIKLHHGEINLISSPESGTSFQIKLPASSDFFSEEEKVYVEDTCLIESKANTTFKDGIDDDTLNLPTNKKEHKVLIVEDNVEMQMFLRDTLNGTYSVFIAENGVEGIELATKNNPDIIISDIMMPQMNGIEMCKVLFKNKSTSHIPIILLTAKNKEASKILGLKSGAIEYIDKPFNVQELLLKINNIITTRKKLLNKLKVEILSNPKRGNIQSKDDLFLDKLVNELDKQIDNSNFKLENLTETLNMSYSVIYRKCQELTGKTLVDFYRSLRLKKASLLIQDLGYNFSEAAFTVGFKDYRYFSKCFKKEFGQSPQQFLKSKKNN